MLARLAEDKAERALRFQSHAPAAQPTPAASAPASASASDPPRATPPLSLADSQLQVRMPGGATLRKTYPAATLLHVVRSDAASKMGRAPETVALRSPFPRKVRAGGRTSFFSMTSSSSPQPSNL